MAEWKDTTSYSRDRERVPTCWSLSVAELRISVVKNHLYHPGKWVMHCEPWFNAREIADDTCSADDVQHIALDNVREKVEATFLALNQIEA